jgi:dUTP pyrophosphatase
MKVKLFKTSEKAKMPTCAYAGTSAGYDIYSTKKVVIPAKGSAMVPNDIRIEIPEGYYFTFDTRGGHGINKDLIAFRGICDAGYTGELAVKMFNLSDKDVIIEDGEKYAQVIFHRVNIVEFDEVTESEWEEYSASTIRGENCRGSSGTK